MNRLPVFSSERLLPAVCALIIAAASPHRPVCQILNPPLSRIDVLLGMGSLNAEAALTRFAGALVLDPDDITRSTVRVVFDPSALRLKDAPQLNLLLQPLLAGPAGERVTFTSERIAARGGGSYEVSGTAEQGGRRHQVRVLVDAAEVSAGRTRIRGTLRRTADAGDRLLAGLAGEARYDLMFSEREMQAGRGCVP